MFFFSFFYLFRIQVSRNAKFYANSKTVFKNEGKIAHKKNVCSKSAEKWGFPILLLFSKESFWQLAFI
jgi:hypothetical protein